MVGDCIGESEVIEWSLIRWLCPTRMQHLASVPGGCSEMCLCFQRGCLQTSFAKPIAEMHEAKACTVGNDQGIGSVCINVSAHGKYPLLQQRKFFGDYELMEKGCS